MSFIGVKKSFTLMELILVVILISTSYLLVFSSSTFKIDNKPKLSIENLKEFLLSNYQYENSLSLVCIEEKLECFIVVDGNVNKELKIQNLFSSVPEVFEYKDSEEKIEFESIKIDEIQKDVFFRLDFNSDYKIKELILDMLDDRVYVFTSLFHKPKLFTGLGEVFDDFQRKKDNVKDAF